MGRLDLLYALANPLYWVLHSIAAYKGLWQLVTRPFYWEKTDHGLVEEPVETPEFNVVTLATAVGTLLEIEAEDRAA